MEGGVIGCESTVHLDPLCTHIKPYGVVKVSVSRGHVNRASTFLGCNDDVVMFL